MVRMEAGGMLAYDMALANAAWLLGRTLQWPQRTRITDYAFAPAPLPCIPDLWNAAKAAEESKEN